MTTTLVPTAAATRDTATTLARWLLGGVAFAAGLIGVAMIVAPGSTGTYFSWRLDPPALAGLVGGCYVASAALFGWAAWRETWVGQRGLCVAVLGLAGPTLVATARHHETFDFHRWQAVAWVVLFAASVTSFGTLVLRRPRVEGAGPGLRRPARVALAVTAVGYGFLAVLLWADPGFVARHGPIEAGPMGLRFVGSWAAFLAIGAGYAVVRPRWEEARLNVIAVGLFPLAAVAAAVAA
jgi:hypothetical protein